MKHLTVRMIAERKGYSRQRVWDLVRRWGIKPRGFVGGVAYWWERDFARFASRDPVKTARRRTCGAKES